MKALELLRQQEGEYRIYEPNSYLCDSMELAVSEFNVNYPDRDWSECYKRVPAIKEGAPPSVAARFLIRWAPADTSVFREELGVALPNWMEEFYGEITCAALPMLKFIEILSPAESVAHEHDRRRGLDETRDPCRLLRFSRAAADGFGFSLYRQLKDDRWVIVGTPYWGCRMPKAPADEWPESETDADINEWLLRLLETDGYPLIKGRKHGEPKYYDRLA
jgi:hypothetical protein